MKTLALFVAVLLLSAALVLVELYRRPLRPDQPVRFHPGDDDLDPLPPGAELPARRDLSAQN